MKSLALLGLVVFMLTGCGMAPGSTDSTKLRAKAEEEASAEVQNKNLAQKASQMEAELKKKHEYYGAITGKYEGDLATNAGNFKVKITMVPSLLPYTGERVRQLSEIENDILNLFFYVQVVQWHPDSEASAVGCRIYGVRPNMDTGYLVAGSNDCPNLYQIYLAEGSTEEPRNATAGATDEIAKSISNQIRSGSLQKAMRLRGTLQPTNSAALFQFDLRRAE